MVKFRTLSNLGGLRTDSPADKIPKENASDIQNIDFSSRGLIQSRGGYEKWGNDITAAGNCERAFLYKKNFGTLKRIKLRVRNDLTNNIIEWHNPSNTTNSINGEWETFIGGLTAGLVHGFTPFNKTGLNRLVLGDGVMNYTIWNGATGLLASATANTITASEILIDEGFTKKSGSLVIDGTEYAYTGGPAAISANTIAFVDSGPDTITDSDNGFVTAGFAAGDTIKVVGSASNDGTYTIAAGGVAAGTLTLVAGDSLTAEGAGDVIAIKNTAKTFTGVTPNPSAITATTGIIQKPDTSTYNTLPKGNIFLTSEARVWLSGVIGSESTLYYSKVGDETNFTAGTNPADAGIQDFPDGGGVITMLDSKENQKVIIHKKDGLMQYRLDYTAASQIPFLDTYTLSDDSGATNQKAGSGQNQASYFTTGVEGIKSLSTAVDGSELNLDSLTDGVLPTIKGFDFDEAATIYYPKKRVILVACKETSDSLYNDKIISFYVNRNNENNLYGNISIDTGFVADWLVDGKDLFFMSSVDQNTYKFYSSNSANGSAQNHRWTSKEFTFDDPAEGKEFNTVYIDGFIKEGTKIKVSVLYGQFGIDGSKSKVLSWDDEYVNVQKVSALGDEALGITSMGASSADILDSYTFSVPIHFDINKNERFKIRVETENDSDTFPSNYWAVSNIAMNPETKGINLNKMINSND